MNEAVQRELARLSELVDRRSVPNALKVLVNGRPGGRAGAEDAGRFGPATATALVVGSIIGVGAFNLPAALANYGPITLLSMALASAGAVVLAVLLGALARRLPAGGGPYAYARVAFGNRVGFLTAWSYWVTGWAGNAGLAVGWMLYVERFVNRDGNRVVSILLVLIGLWAAAAVNLSGVRNVGAVQVVTTVVKFVALAFMSTVGLLFIRGAHFTHGNVSGQSAVAAIGAGLAISLFSYLGVETATVAAGRVRDPERNVPLATIVGTIATAAVYLLSLVAVFGVLPSQQLATETEPYAAAVDAMFGGAGWGNLMALVVIVSGLGALNGWTLVCAEMPRAAARDGLFPEQFNRLSRTGAPVFGIVASTLLASVAMIVPFLGADGVREFTTLVLASGILAAIPYAVSALAQIKLRWNDERWLWTAPLVRDLAVATLALLFSILFVWYSRNTYAGDGLGYWAPFLVAALALLLGVPVYNAQRGRMREPETSAAFR